MYKLVCFFSAFFFSSAIYADTVVNFKGTLVADPCIVTTDTEEQFIEFGAIPAKTFMNHARSAPKNFSIHLTDCDLSLGKTVSLVFNGPEDAQQTGAFAVQGDAKGIAIALEEGAGNAITPGNATEPVNLNQDDTILDYTAYVQAEDYSKVKEGAFEARVIFSLEYE